MSRKPGYALCTINQILHSTVIQKIDVSSLFFLWPHSKLISSVFFLNTNFQVSIEQMTTMKHKLKKIFYDETSQGVQKYILSNIFSNFQERGNSKINIVIFVRYIKLFLVLDSSCQI